MISRTKINERMNRKRNPELAESIFLAKKNNHMELAKKLSVPTRERVILNLTDLDKIKEDKVVIVGKILGSGDIKKKISLVALGYSEQAKEKLKKAGCEIKTIKQEMEKNPKLTGYKIL